MEASLYVPPAWRIATPLVNQGVALNAELVHVEACARAHAAGAAASVAQKDRDGIIGMPSLDPDRRRDFFPVEFELDQVFGLDSHALGHGRAHQHWIVPGELVHRLGQFLQPAVVGETAVVDGGIAAEINFNSFVVGLRRRRRVRAFH